MIVFWMESVAPNLKEGVYWKDPCWNNKKLRSLTTGKKEWIESEDKEIEPAYIQWQLNEYDRMFNFLEKLDIKFDIRNFPKDMAILNKDEHNIIWISLSNLSSTTDLGYVLDNLSSFVLEFAEENNVEIIIDVCRESIDDIHSVTIILDKFFSKTNFPEKLLKIIINNYGVPAMKYSGCFRDITHWPIDMYVNHYDGHWIYFQNALEESFIKKYNFCCLAGILDGREHRVNFISRAKEQGLLDDKFFLTKLIEDKNIVMKQNRNCFLDDEILETFIVGDNRKLKNVRNLYDKGYENRLPVAALESHVHIVLETRYKDQQSLTEKTFKPLMAGIPFLVLGSQNITKTLTDMGFVLYDEVFDYSYDFAEDWRERIDLLLVELHRLRTIDLSSISDILKSKLEYNRHKFILLSTKKSEWLYALTGDREYVS